MIYFIIFGWRAVTYSIGHGRFHCPGCQTEQSYKHRRVRRFFTLYFIPLIPLEKIGEFVECEMCRQKWQPLVLSAALQPTVGSEHAELR
jgi:zinc-ribbon family